MGSRPLDGIRVVEVAQFTFVPAAGAVLADWGADVVKIEHAVHGDAQRGLGGTTGMAQGNYKPIMQHGNRGKRSVGLDLSKDGGLKVLHNLVESSDVFLTNFLPSARRRLKIDVSDIRSVNPQIIYARGTGFGSLGPDADRGGFDGTAFWARAGSASGATPPGSEYPTYMPSGAYGDSMGGMTIAGGIAAALLGRERSGEPAVIDVSLLSVGAWATGLSVDLSLMTGEPVRPEFGRSRTAVRNPLVGSFQTSDGRWIQLSMIQVGRYWAELCDRLGCDELIVDARFSTTEALMENAAVAAEQIRAVFARRTLADWAETLKDFDGPWAIHQDSLELSRDPQLRANGYVVPITDFDGNPREIVANPVQFDQTPVVTRRAPEFAEDTDAVLRELGLGDEELLELKLQGAVT